MSGRRGIAEQTLAESGTAMIAGWDAHDVVSVEDMVWLSVLTLLVGYLSPVFARRCHPRRNPSRTKAERVVLPEQHDRQGNWN